MTSSLPPPAPLVNSHPMITRSNASVHKPRAYLCLTPFLDTLFSQALFALKEPHGFKSASKHPEWLLAMEEEIQALWQITLGLWFLTHLTKILLAVVGFSKPNCYLMVPLSTIKHVLSPKATHNKLVSTLMRLSSPSLNPQLFALFYHLLPRLVGLFGNLMSRMHFYMAFLIKKSLWNKPQVMLILATLIMCIALIRLFTALNKVHRLGFTILALSFYNLVFVAAGPTLLSLFISGKSALFTC